MSNSSPDYRWNLLPWRAQAQQASRQHFLMFLLKTIISAIVLVGVAHLVMLSGLYFLTHRNDTVRQNIRTLQPHALTAQQLEQQTATLQGNVQFLHQLNSQRQPPVDLLAALPQVMTDGIFFTDVIYQSETVTIKGRAETLDQVHQLVTKMQQQGTFQHLQLIGSAPDTTIPPYQIDFSVQFNWHKVSS
jgi:Tfp pilus assembly protein PilN